MSIVSVGWFDLWAHWVMALAFWCESVGGIVGSVGHW